MDDHHKLARRAGYFVGKTAATVYACIVKFRTLLSNRKNGLYQVGDMTTGPVWYYSDFEPDIYTESWHVEFSIA